MSTKVQVTMDIEQARLVLKAMGLYSRLLMGQFEEIKWLFCAVGAEGERYKRNIDTWHENFDIISTILRQTVYPELVHGSYWGITGYSERNKCPPKATIVYDVYKTMEHAISWHEHPEGGMTVNFDKPMHFYTGLPLPDVKVYDSV